jgi:hypothetical protein
VEFINNNKGMSPETTERHRPDDLSGDVRRR